MPIIYLVRKDGIPVYVGFTKRTIRERWLEHCNEARRIKNRKCGGRGKLHPAINKYGDECFTIESVYETEDEKHALNIMEYHFIWLYQTHHDYGRGGYNLSFGGDGHLQLSDSTRQKMAENTRNRKLSEEAKQKIRLSKLGKKRKPFTDEARKNMSLAHKNSVKAQEQQKRMIAALKGKQIGHRPGYNEENSKTRKRAKNKEWYDKNRENILARGRELYAKRKSLTSQGLL